MLNIEAGVKDFIDDPKCIFHLLSREEKEEVEQILKLTHYRKNEIIFREGDKPSGFLVLARGKVMILKEGVGGRQQIMRMIKPMGLLGFRALFAGENYIASAVTLEESLICSVNSDFIMNKAIRNSNFSEQIIKRLSKELGFSIARTVSLTQKHIRGRLAESLILLKRKYGYESDGHTLNVYLSREDIANLSNMTTSNAIRTLSIFANENVIAVDGRKIKILDFNTLDRISKLG